MPKSSRRLIKPDVWYVVYEKSLVKFVVLKYEFKEKSFAKLYIDDKLSKKYQHLFILRGDSLINLGIKDIPRFGLSSSVINKVAAVKRFYYFPDELPVQRRKTLRTIYRRNLKRRQGTYMKSTKNKIPKPVPTNEVVKAVEEKPIKFYKRVYKKMYNNLLYTRLIPKIYQRGENWVIEDSRVEGLVPAVLNEIFAYYLTLVDYYQDLDSGDDDFLGIAIKLRESHSDKYKKYLKKYHGWGTKPQENPLSEKQAFREFVARGFLPKNLTKIGNGDQHVRALVGDLVYPKIIKDQAEGIAIQMAYGLPWYTGVVINKR